MPKQILIIKLGALGDVIRTTPLLRTLEGDITWVTSTLALPLLSNNPFITTLLAFDTPGFRLERRFDLVINLEDDLASAELACAAASGRIVGPYLDNGTLAYDTTSSEWFDMSLSSRYGRAKADELKMRNRKTYQEMIFAAVGLSFSGEGQVLNLPLQNATVPSLIGIEDRAGGVWPTKCWSRYQELANLLSKLGYQIKFFRQRQTVAEYADDINECEFVICGDTLAMHLAVALDKRVVALFTCTSPHEIYGYGKLAKVVSPLLYQYFYRREYCPEAANAISTASVAEKFLAIAGYSIAGRFAGTGKENDAVYE